VGLWAGSETPTISSVTTDPQETGRVRNRLCPGLPVPSVTTVSSSAITDSVINRAQPPAPRACAKLTAREEEQRRVTASVGAQVEALDQTAERPARILMISAEEIQATLRSSVRWPELLASSS